MIRKYLLSVITDNIPILSIELGEVVGHNGQSFGPRSHGRQFESPPDSVRIRPNIYAFMLTRTWSSSRHGVVPLQAALPPPTKAWLFCESRKYVLFLLNSQGFFEWESAIVEVHLLTLRSSVP